MSGMTTMTTERICVPDREKGHDPRDHARHPHVPGVTRVIVGAPHPCANPQGYEEPELGSRYLFTRCRNCMHLI